MPLQFSTTFKGISLPTCYARIVGLFIYGNEQRFVVTVEHFATQALASTPANRLGDVSSYEFKNGDWTTFNQGLPNLGAANTGKNPLTLAYDALKTRPTYAGAIDV